MLESHHLQMNERPQHMQMNAGPQHLQMIFGTHVIGILLFEDTTNLPKIFVLGMAQTILGSN